jgi:radical SAM superfamily enzyme YgiQ (UPF0313 family)
MKILLASLFSARYPAIGETHALSVLAGVLGPRLHSDDDFEIYDMVLDGRERYDHLLEVLAKYRPNVLCLSIGYGTFSKISHVLNGLNEIQINPIRIYGGALPHYLHDTILDRVDPDAVIVRGEGDETLPVLIDRIRSNQPFNDVPNLAFCADGARIQTPRKLAELSTLPPPHRSHLSRYSDKSFQVFTEFSRGCSWAGCTFCLRGLLDNEGKRTEYRHFSKGRAEADLSRLAALGFQSVTFADEDFFGGGIADLELTVQTLEQSAAMLNGMPPLHFDVSATPHSIFTSDMPDNERTLREALLSRARAAGVRKIFFGIESGSASQLKRYAKGHTKGDAIRVIKKCVELGFDIEIGWILFDPLVTIEELEENLSYLAENDFARYASYVFNEIRIQKESRYVQLLKSYQLRTGVRLISDEIDEDTLSYKHSYADKRVVLLIQSMHKLEEIFRRVHYPLKNLVRFGVSGVAGEHAPRARTLLAEVRTNMVVTCLAMVRSIRSDSHASSLFANPSTEAAWREQVARFQREASKIATAILEAEPNPLAERILEVAN